MEQTAIEADHAEIGETISRACATGALSIAWARERVDDVTTHPAFAQRRPLLRQLLRHEAPIPPGGRTLSYEEDGERHSLYCPLKARTKDDLARRSTAHRLLAEAKLPGLLGRSPDYRHQLHHPA